MATGATGTIEVLNPTARRSVSESALAARPPSLDGKVLGLLSNGKPNSALLIGAIGDHIAKKYRLADIFRVTKGETEKGSAGPMPDAMRDRLIAKCDVVLNAMGD